VTGPGLQEERTALAWQRTGVTGTLVGGVAVLGALHRGSGPLLVVCLAVTAVTAALAGRASTRPGRGPHGAEPRSPWGRLLATAAIPVLLGVPGLLLALT